MIQTSNASRPLFPLGQVVATPGAIQALAKSGETPRKFLIRHVSGDFGTVGKSDWAANESAIRDGARVFSAYLTSAGEKV